MTTSDFENQHFTNGETISFMDKAGTTRYGIFNGNYDPKVPSFEFKAKDTETSETVYLKDVQDFFKPGNK